MTKTCPICGKEFAPSIHHRNYCSAECAKKGQYRPRPRIERRKCLICGKEIDPDKRLVLYCSPECAKEAQRAAYRRWYQRAKSGACAVPKICPICGREVPEPSGSRKYCSDACAKAARRQTTKIWVEKNLWPKQDDRHVCRVCGKEIVEPNRRKYCSDECAMEARRAQCRKNSAEWAKRNEHDTSTQDTRTDRVRKVYMTRTCAMCGREYLGHMRSKYCDSCLPEARREAQRRHKERKQSGEARQLGSIDQCVRCGKDYIVKGALQRYCPECAPIAVKEVDNAQSREWAKANPGAMAAAKERERAKPKPANYMVCPICGETFAKTPHRRKYCSDACAAEGMRARYREYRRRKGLHPTPRVE